MRYDPPSPTNCVGGSRFSVDGKSYEIDLNEKHAAALRDAFAPFIGSARRAGGPAAGSRPRMSARTSTGAGRPREETAAIREWATANGLEVSTRGRISSTVLEAYENRGNTALTLINYCSARRWAC